MTNKELIEIAKICATGECPEDCPNYNIKHYSIENVLTCTEDLLFQLAEAFETATNTIPVGNGKDYMVVNE